jgi:hypothetical protein
MTVIDRSDLMDVLGDLVDEHGMVEVLQSLADVAFDFSTGKDRWRRTAAVIDACSAQVERILGEEVK